jgi:hypothetical protein
MAKANMPSLKPHRRLRTFSSFWEIFSSGGMAGLFKIAVFPNL